MMRSARPLPWIGLGCVLLGCSSVDVLGARPSTLEETPDTPPLQADPDPTEMPNVLEERRQIPLSQVNAQLNDAFLQLFFGDPETEAVFRDQGDGTGYIEDINNNDVRTDSMGYGMLVTVQLDQREVFDKLWSWTKSHMRSTTGASEGLLRWRCETSGDNCAASAATDSSSIIATSLFMAESRWGAAGAHDYRADGVALLDAMTSAGTREGAGLEGVKSLLDIDAALPRSGSAGEDGQVPTDYLMPAFYEIWAEHNPARASLWGQMAANARDLLVGIAHETNGLLPELVTYDGQPVAGHSDYQVTTSRALLNRGWDHAWNGRQPWFEDNDRLLAFFLSEGVESYGTAYTREGEALNAYNTTAHLSVVAVAAGVSENPDFDVFLQALLDEPIPTGTFRYFDGMLYMLSLLTLSGQMTPN